MTDYARGRADALKEAMTIAATYIDWTGPGWDGAAKHIHDDIEALAQQPQDEDEKPLMDDALLKKMSDNVTKLDDHRPHMTFYGACMACGRDVVVVCPVGTKNLECAHCHKPAVERVQIHDAEWFDRYMNGAKTKKQRDMRTMVLLNAKRMGL